jgi:hypothetical protein
MKVKIVLPGTKEDEVDTGLRRLTKAIEEHGGNAVQGFLGGEYGYGDEFENEVFEMHPYYWGDCDCGFDDAMESIKLEHRPECYQTELMKEEEKAGKVMELKYGFRTWPEEWSCSRQQRVEDKIYKNLCKKHNLPLTGCAVHCTCDYRERLGNEYKRLGFPTSKHLATCSYELPNFKYKPTGFEVRWYKYIGRSMEYSGKLGDIRKMINHCIESLDK